MAYRDDIDGLNPDHRWNLDGNANDSIGSANGTNSGGVFTGVAITEDATNSWLGNGLTDRITLPTTTTINNSAQQRKAVSGWLMVTDFQAYPCSIYGEGESTTNFQLVMGYGNQLLFECTEATNFPTGLQIYGIPAVPNRVYHVCMKFLGNTQGNEVQFFIDGVEQTNADPSDRQPDTADLNSRGVGVFGDPATGSGPILGGATVLQQCPQDVNLQFWAAWGDTVDADLTDTEIRETLFERGCLADFSIATNTEANMQTSLDAITDSQSNSPCCIEVDAVSGGGDFTLTSDKVFDTLASIHYRYNGTSGNLTIVNVDGDQQGNATIGSAPFGGTLTIANRQTLTVTVLDAINNNPINGARVYIEADTGGPLTAGTVIMDTATNGSGVATASFDYSSDQPIIGRVRKGSSSTYYKTNSIPGPLGSVPLDVTILMVPDE